MLLEKSSIATKPGSEKSFGYVFTAIFAIVAFYPTLFEGELRVWSLLISIVLLAITLIKPALYKKPNYWWFRFGMLLGGIIAPIVMGVVYIVTIIPTGIIAKLLGKDLLRIKLDRQAPTYWIERDTPLQPMKNQF
ncbi:hypothetical protein JYT87_02865 [Nitrospira defluvii]|nr:hypothetical protein [Nitrospira defluvii]